MGLSLKTDTRFSESESYRNECLDMPAFYESTIDLGFLFLFFFLKKLDNLVSLGIKFIELGKWVLYESLFSDLLFFLF